MHSSWFWRSSSRAAVRLLAPRPRSPRLLPPSIPRRCLISPRTFRSGKPSRLAYPLRSGGSATALRASGISFPSGRPVRGPELESACAGGITPLSAVRDGRRGVRTARLEAVESQPRSSTRRKPSAACAAISWLVDACVPEPCRIRVSERRRFSRRLREVEAVVGQGPKALTEAVPEARRHGDDASGRRLPDRLREIARPERHQAGHGELGGNDEAPPAGARGEPDR